MKKSILLFLLILLSFTLVSCKDEEENKVTYDPINLVSHKYESFSLDDYNRDLFYVNTLDFRIADPTVIYAEHGEGAGYFYAFGTSDLIGGQGFQCWRSKDLVNWEYVGVALKPDPLKTWGLYNHWAPEIMYDEELGKYLLFYNADELLTGNKHISVAYSDNVMGPYTIPDNMLDANGKMLSADKPVVNFIENEDKLPEDIKVRKYAIDACPFIDPVSKKKYLYWSWYDDKQEIFAMEMQDWFTPIYETVTQITKLNKTSMEEDAADIFDGNHALNEGPYVFYKDGQYFLTFSVFPFTSPHYQVRLAVSDSPISGFEKLPVDDGGVVISTDPVWTHIVSAGHHCFVKAGEQLYIVYHTFFDRNSINNGRSLAVDEVKFVKNSVGQTVIHTNGPTYSLQPIPSIINGYKNVADKAKITATNVDEKSNLSYLNDGVVKMMDEDLAQETIFNGSTTITMEFDNPVSLKSIMVYNSYVYDHSFPLINSIDLEYVHDEKGNTNIASLGSLAFDYAWNTYKNMVMEPGGAAICEFEELPVKKVTLKINMGNYDFAISDIKLIANEKENITYKNTFADTYTYNNTININNHKYEGEILGGTEFYDATFGWDFTNDKLSLTPYVKATAINSSYVYFKDLVSTKFYAEGYVSTFANTSYRFDNNPKMGMVIRNKNTGIYFYIDAKNNFTNQVVGYATCDFGNPNSWKYQTNENKNIDITYSNSQFDLEKNYVKMAILRDGDKLYLLMDGKIIYTLEGIEGLGALDASCVGFLGINSPMIVRNYQVVTDSDAVDVFLDSFGI